MLNMVQPVLLLLLLLLADIMLTFLAQVQVDGR